jgi:biotin carboxyl carrier protein
MPGLVRAVAVAVGDVVALGQRLLVLEAMKMENDIQAGQAGTVTAVHVAAGDTVQTGRPLVEIE